MIKKGIISLFILMCTFFAFGAEAQVRESDLSIDISPSYPAPNQNVTVSLNSFVADLNKAFVSWSLNGDEVLSGVGKKTFSFNSGKAGQQTIINVDINTVGGQNISKTITIAPAEIDLLWEASDAYVPPFYKGKALVPPEGTFKVVAVPNIKTPNGNINPKNLSYTWDKDGKIQTTSSGWGKNYFTYKATFLDRDMNVKVLISNILGNVNSEGEIDLEINNPKILFYEKDTSLGTKWGKALHDGFVMDKLGETFVVEPYFFSSKNLNSPNLSFEWTLNGNKINTPATKNVLSVKPEGNQGGSARINVNIKNTKTLFQSLNKQLNVNF